MYNRKLHFLLYKKPPAEKFDETYYFFKSNSLLTEIAAQMGNATEGGEMKTALWTMALLLFVLSLVFILLIHYFSRPKKDKE